MSGSTKKINLAICAPGELYGGVERFVLTFGKFLQEETDIAPLVILFQEGKHYESLKSAGIDTIVLRPRWKYDISTIWRLARRFRACNIDVVHAHGYKATILGAVAAKLCGVSVIKTEHGKLEPSRRRRLSRLKMRCNLMLDGMVTRRFVDHVVYVTRDLRESLGMNGRAGRSSVVYNAIPDISADPGIVSADIDGGAFNIGIVGRVSEVKGHRVLFRALKKLHDLPNIKVSVLGEGPLENELKDFCKNNALQDAANFLGFRTNIYDYMSAFDVLVMPSLHEGLPYTLLESMYLKVPVIASNVGGLGEVLSSGEDAILVEPGNIDQLAEAIRSLYTNGAERRRLAENAYRNVRKNFMISRMAREYVEIFMGSLS